jgi:hypothetical protein
LVPAPGGWSDNNGKAQITANLLRFDSDLPYGDSIAHKIFTNLPPHYSIRIRFKYARSNYNNIDFNYYIDSKFVSYDGSAYPSR